MADIYASNLKLPGNTISQDDLFNLDLIQKDKTSDLLFLIGTLIGMYVNSKAEQQILCPEETQDSSQSAAAREATLGELVVIFILFFLAAAVILTSTACARLSKQKSEISEEPDQTTINNIKGSELNILGLLLRVIGYVLSAVGNQIRVDNPV